MIRGIHLGLAIFRNGDWKGTLYPSALAPGRFLEVYGQVFNAVEGNGTFYGLPRAETLSRWREQTPEEFRFCFKLPREMTHSRRLRVPFPVVAHWLRHFAPLGARLGPFMVQLPRDFGPADLDVLKRFLGAASADGGIVRFAVEPRHPLWCEWGGAAEEFDGVLKACGAERVILDARPYHRACERGLPDLATEHPKPRLPVRDTAIGPNPVVRYIGAPAVADNDPWLTRWMDRVANWRGEGRVPYVFIHTPSQRDAPALAAHFFQGLRARLAEGVGVLPRFPGAAGGGDGLGSQLDLFSDP